MRTSRFLLSLGLGLVTGCQAQKKPPTDADFVPNPPAMASRVAQSPPADSSADAKAQAQPKRVQPTATAGAAGRRGPAPEPAPVPPPPVPTVSDAEDESVWFDDDFARGNKCDRGNGRNGFGWAGVQSGDPDSVYAVRDPTSPSGCALAFVFGGNPDLADDAWAEQRFKVGKVRGDPVRQIFVGIILQVPGNYIHRDAKGPDNNKLLRLWDENYRPSVVHVGMSALRKSDGRGSQLTVEYKEGGKTDNFNKGPWSPILSPGKVDTIGFFVRTSSGIGASDGVIRIWWNRQLKLDLSGLRLTNSVEGNKGFNGIGNGYLLGWANSGFTERTEFRVSRFILAPEPLPAFLP